jgi:hypothetical protein
MTEHAPERIWSGIDIPKTIAGVLAAVSAAVVGSFLGVAGTLAGAALASVVGSVGTEVYHRLVDRGHKRIKSTFVTAPAAVGTPPVAAAEDESPSEPEPPAQPRRRQTPWSRVALVAGALFVLAMGTLTAFELITGKSAADAVGSTSSSGTTICSVGVCGGRDNHSPAPSPSTSPSTTDPDATTGPAGAPSTTEPAQSDNGSTQQPTNDATTQAPAEDDQQGGATAPNGATEPDAATENGGTE